jgi:hypothetical protein
MDGSGNGGAASGAGDALVRGTMAGAAAGAPAGGRTGAVVEGAGLDGAAAGGAGSGTGGAAGSGTGGAAGAEGDGRGRGASGASGGRRGDASRVGGGDGAGGTGRGTGARSIAWLVVAALVFLAGPWLALYARWQPAHVWGLNIMAGIAVLVAISRATGQHLLTDERRRWSLSRLQLLTWTALLLPSVWTMVGEKLLGGADDALALGMNDNMWALLGITAASFVGSPLILERKRATPGALDVRAPGAGDGELRDLFRGEDAGSAEMVDIGRVQMCLFTAIAVCAYFAACWHAFATQSAATLAFPPMSQNLVALLGISHATYLVGKVPARIPVQASI